MNDLQQSEKQDNPDGIDYGEPAYDAWLRHVRWAVGKERAPYSLDVAEKQWPILKDARAALWPRQYRNLVETINPRYKKQVRVPKRNLEGSQREELA